MLGKLTQLCIITCSGEDSEQFLQGQLTANLKLIKANDICNNARFAAHCSVKGRIMSLFLLIKASENNYYLLAPKAMESIILDNLKKYAAFSKTTLTSKTAELVAIGFSNNETITNQKNFPKQPFTQTQLKDGRTIALYQPDSFTEMLDNIDHEWHLQDILNGLPVIYPQTSEQVIPQRINLQELGSLSFKKGCYLGQEVLSRLHYLGKVKYKMALGKINLLTEMNISDSQFEAGNKVYDLANKPIGQVIDSIISIDSETQSQILYLLFEKSIECDQCQLNQLPIELLPLPYAI